MQLGNTIKDSIYYSIHDSLRYSIYDSVKDSVSYTIRTSLYNIVWDNSLKIIKNSITL